MHSFVASDDSVVSSQLQQLLLKFGYTCPPTNVVPLDAAVTALAALNRALPGSTHSPVEAAGPATVDVLCVVLSPAAGKSLKTMDELRRITSARVFAIGPTVDSKLVLQAIRHGAHEYLDAADLEIELSAALDRLQTDLAAIKVGPLIGMLGTSGGSGASTLAVNLAVAIAQKQGSCGLLDARAEAGDLAPLLDLRPTYTTQDLCDNLNRLDQSMIEGSLVRHPSGVGLLGAPQRATESTILGGDGLARIASLMGRVFPAVIVDLDGSHEARHQPLFRLSELLVFVLRLDFTALRRTRRKLDFLEEIGVPRDRIEVVVNRFGQPNEVPAAKAEEALGLKIWHYVPDDSKAVNRANNNGVPVVLDAPTARVSRAIVELARKIESRQHLSYAR